ncbi:ComEC/Rec2 family competence protein [Aquisalinus flavus]|nr:ComEC/Rec2 family competence protein [Aquisalinus flavus]MBD0427800.1 ComEC/Rec2 family competence protein [Aquisalinus flavus]
MGARATAFIQETQAARRKRGRRVAWQAFGQRVLARLAGMIRAERTNRFLWVPVFLAVGIGIYFSLPVEPPFRRVLAGGACLVAIALGWRYLYAWPSGAGIILIAIITVTAGFMLAMIRTQMVAAPVLTVETGFVDIEGLLLEVEEGPDGRRMIIAPSQLGDLEADVMPARVRLTWRGDGFAAAPGDVIALRGNLSPPPAPVAPGAYDFARQLYFERIGAVGFAVSTPRVLTAGEPTTGHRIESLRLALGRRITEAIGPDRPAVAAVCVALVTGKRDAVPPQTEAALRDAGLAHLLAISGLHMGLAAGLLFFVIRFLLVQSEYLALHYPVKKWAAAAALLGATAYLLISGAAWSTQRAYIMAGIFFVAILIDRRALSLRNVAIAATLILVLRPEALFQAGFQMSFAAVTVLIAAYEWWQKRQLDKPYDPLAESKLAGPLGGAWRYTAGLAMTSVLAGWATGPFAIFHFNRIAAYGLAGNLLAMPIMGFVIMPAAIMGLVLMPVGLDWIAWQVMAFGVGLVIDIATMVSGWPGALVHVAQMNLSGFLTVIAGGLVLCLMKTALRYGGLVMVLAGFLLGGHSPQPHLLIAPDAANIAFRLDGETVLLNRNRERFAAGVWLTKAGQSDDLRDVATVPELARDGRGSACDQTGCVLRIEDQTIAISDTPLTLAEDCGMAQLVIARYPVAQDRAGRCRARLIETGQIARDGTLAITIDRNGRVTLRTNRAARGTRPWTAGGVG